MADIGSGSVLVTGAASGLGLAVARRLASVNPYVVAMDLPSSNGLSSTKPLGVTFSPGDVTDPDSLSEALDTAERLAPLRFVVHCAGRGGPMRILDKSGQPGSLEHFGEIVRVNLLGSFNVMRLAASRMAANDVVDGERGAIVLTASIAAFEGQIGQVSYAASKAGVHGMIISSARDLAAVSVRVNAIAPGVFDTPLLGNLGDEVREALARSIPAPPRLGDPDEFAKLALHILENGYINGETIRIDGALRMGFK